MRIGVWGAGALGLLWGARLTQLFPGTVLITRTKAQRDRLQSEGIHLTTLSGKVETIPVKARWAEEEIRNPRFDFLFIMVKQPHLPEVARSLSMTVPYDTPIVLWQNGVGHEAYLSGYTHLYGAVTTEGALREGPAAVRHTGEGITWIGPYTEAILTLDPLATLVAHIKKLPLSVAMEERIGARMWSKLMINCAINPLTALLRVSNGRLLQVMGGTSMMESILSEAVEVAVAMGYEMDLEEVLAQAVEVCHKTSANHSSMLQDLLNNRPTEIEAINGAVVRFGDQMGIATPVNRLLVQLVHAATDANLEIG